jgi:hypothetical protein
MHTFEHRLLLEDVGQAHAGVLDEASEVVHLYCFSLEGWLLDVGEKLVLHLERSSLRVSAKLPLHLEQPLKSMQTLPLVRICCSSSLGRLMEAQKLLSKTFYQGFQHCFSISAEVIH